ncbi:MAG: hypothetical protein IIZ73_09435 [Ruminococcus sp.]|nr:hypothetical protein [Ruminococcus sp.]
MTLKQMLDSTGIKCLEAEFRADMKPPYMVYELDCETVCADSVVVWISGEVTLYLAVSRADVTSEAAVENVLDTHKVAYTKNRSWIGGTQKVYLCEYVFEARAEW